MTDATGAEPPRHFTHDYVERVVLRDGTAIELRLVRPEDKPLLRAGFDRLSAASRYARFLAPKQTLSDDELRYLTELDQETHFALGAVDERGIGLGVARFIRLAGAPGVAEAAVAVADEAHGRGLGKLLFMRLCAAAAERGIETFRCEVLGSNNSMKHLLEHVTPDHQVEVASGVMSIEIALPQVTATAPMSSLPPQGPMYRLFRAAAENAVEWTDAVRRLWRRTDDDAAVDAEPAPATGGTVHYVDSANRSDADDDL